MMTEQMRIVVAIFWRYCWPFSQVWRQMAFAVGILYGGSSITKGRSSSFTNLLRTMAERIASTIPSR